jgi:thioredoxin reductase
MRHGVVEEARHEDGRFFVNVARGGVIAARKLLLATGVVDHLPDLPGIAAYYGTSVHHCPYCDGYEHRDGPLVVVGPSAKCSGMARMMTRWSTDVSFAPDDPDSLSDREARGLAAVGIRLLTSPVVGLAGEGAHLAEVLLADGSRRPCRALFFNTGQHQRSPLIERFGIQMTSKGGAVTGRREETHIRGLFVAGDATRDVQFVIVAAAEGATAAVAIDKELMIDDGLLADGA